ncbi:hypothetical protein GCM10027596_17530 [Nocardioides korecus]
MAEVDEGAATPGGGLPAPEDRGRTSIADKVVERIASIATGEVEGATDTRSGLLRAVRGGLPHAEAVVAGGTSRIKVEVAATWPTPLSRLATQVREHVSERVATLTGVTVTAVDVTVADVVHVETAHRRVQ